MSQMPWPGARSGLCRHRADEFWELFSIKALLGEQTEIINGTQGLRSRRSSKLIEKSGAEGPGGPLYVAAQRGPGALPLAAPKEESWCAFDARFLLIACKSGVRVCRRACQRLRFSWMQRVWRTSDSIKEMASLHRKGAGETRAGLRLSGFPPRTPSRHAAREGVA